MENNNNNKSHFLDERGLQIYDQKIKEYIDNSIENSSKVGESSEKITVDSSLSSTSTNPVQNKVIKNELDNKQPKGNYVTINTSQDITATKTFDDIRAKGNITVNDINNDSHTNYQNKQIHYGEQDSDGDYIADYTYTLPDKSGVLATTDDLNAYQPAGDYASSTHNHDGVYQPKGNYVTTDTVQTITGDKTFSNIRTNANVIVEDANNDSRTHYQNKQIHYGEQDSDGDYIADYTYTLPDKSGVLATTDDIPKTGYITTGKNYKVSTDSNGNLYVYVPWTDTNTTYSTVTQSANGLMSAADKKKLDGIETGANKITVDSSLSSTSTNPVQNKVIKNELDNKQPKGNYVTTDTAQTITGDKTFSTIRTNANVIVEDANNDSRTHYQNKQIHYGEQDSDGDYIADYTYTLPDKSGVLATTDIATSSSAGLVKSSTTGTTSNRYYNVQVNDDGTMKVNVPWTDTNTTYSTATQSANGLMSSSDKKKLDGIAEGANKITVDSSLNSTSTNPVQNKVIKSALDGKAGSSHSHSSLTNSSGRVFNVPTGGSGGEQKTLVITDDLNAYQPAGNYASSTHKHPISDINDLQSTIDGIHTDMGLQDEAIAGKADENHVHPISDITGLQTALDGKAASSHAHTIGNVTGLQTALDSKQAKGNYVTTDAAQTITGDKTFSTIRTNSNIIVQDTNNDTNTYYQNKKISYIGYDSDGEIVDDYTYTLPDKSGILATTDDLPKTGYSTNGKNYKVSSDSSGNLYVYVPWTDTNTTYSTATQSANGLMSAADKKKLDGIAEGANKITIDSALSSTSTNPVQNKVINSALNNYVTGTTFINYTTYIEGEVNKKANASHDHDISDINGLQSALDGKSNTGHGHAISDITNLQSTIDGIYSDIGLQDEAIAGKADSVHTHTKSQITDFPAIPTVNNPTITINQGGTKKGSFTLNQSGATTIDLTDNNTTYTAGAGLSLSSGAFSVKTGYTNNGKNYKVTTDSNGNLYVNVPWANDTWRPVVDNLTTTDATKSLSANQGKVLKDLVDGKAASSHTHSDLVPKNHNNRFYPFIGSAYRKANYKITLPISGRTSSSHEWMMITMELILGGSYNSGANGTIFLSYYFRKDSSNHWYADAVRAIGIGNKLADNEVRIQYDISNPGVFYVHSNNNEYNSFSIQNLTANDTAPNFDFTKTTIEDVNSIPSGLASVPLTCLDSKGDNKLYVNNTAVSLDGHTHTSVADIYNNKTTTFAYSQDGLGYDSYTWLAGWNGYELRAVNKSQFATSGHTHSYLPLSGGTLTGPLGFNSNYLIKPVADFRTRNSTFTGAITITLPANIPDTMVSMWIDVYNYVTNTSFSVHVGGYPYTGSTWKHNPFAMVYGATHTIRLGHNGTNFVIYIGETNSTWSYPQISIRDVILGFTPGYDKWKEGWNISFSTSFSNVSAVINNYAWTTKNFSMSFSNGVLTITYNS